jgi:LacI family transcriptional regulator
VLGCAKLPSPRILILLDTSAAWSRGVLKGFAGFAHEADWTLLHYHPSADFEWLAREWKPAAVILPPGCHRELPRAARHLPMVTVNADRSPEGMASVLPDEERVADIAAAHLIDKGLRHVTSFRFTDDPFAVTRERRFFEKAECLNGRIAPGWWQDDAEPASSTEQPLALVTWLRKLPKPCGIFACCDVWARVVARYCRVSDIGIPEEIALVGVDNDLIECELLSPPLSSVAIPWRNLGREAALFVQQALAGRPIAGARVLVPPLDVVQRRSSEVLAISDPLVARAVSWICENAAARLDVCAVVQAVSTSRQRLERRFHAVLGRTIMQEIRRARVNIAKQLLSTTSLDLLRIARLSGFTNQALMSIAFSRELGQAPSTYRRTLKRLDLDDD